MATAMTAFGAEYYQDENLAHWSWYYLLENFLKKDGMEGFEPQYLENTANQKLLKEIPWISTNFVSQWCLNVIMALEMIGKYMPRTLEDIKKDGFLRELECDSLV